MFNRTVIQLSVALLLMPAAGQAQSLPPASEDILVDPGFTRLPSPDTSEAIQQLKAIGKDSWISKGLQPREMVVDPMKVDDIGREKIESNVGGGNSLPFVAPTSMIIQFKPQTTQAEIEDYLSENELPVIQTFPGIGAVQVEVDISEYFSPELSDTSANDAIIRGVLDAVADYKKDPRVLSATPDIVLTDKSNHEVQEITNVLRPSEVTTIGADDGEASDWGIGDIEADEVWPLPGARDGVIFGVMDVGFGRHSDIIYLDFPATSVANNHGNHVAAIGCGRHDGLGIRGVLPNCFVRARSGDVFFEAAGANPQLNFMVLFSQILSTLYNFVEEQDDVSAFNVSLGYNWRSNFGINPDLPESAQWRQLVEIQGALLVSLLELANRKDKVIFSAAGNDSTGLAVPISAKYASPFNWAAIQARESGIAPNGIIVGAHGPDGKRAAFSNSNARISCPGVNVLSALAYDAADQPSSSAYGRMSGTSMASPYCSAAHILFRLVRPGYTGVEAVECMLASNAKTDDGTPMLRLSQALIACPDR